MEFRIELTDCDDQFTCRSDETVLEGMRRTGHQGIPSGCRGGACGVCKVAVVEGRFSMLRMSSCHVSEADMQAGHVLACRIFPLSDLRMRVIGKMKVKFGQTLAGCRSDQGLRP
jgi:ferredoxin